MTDVLMNLPGRIRVEDLVSELASVSATLLEAEADTLTGVAISLLAPAKDNSPPTANKRRLMQYPGSTRIADFPAIVMALVNTLKLNGIEEVAEVEISLQAWRGDERAQVWGEEGFIERMFFDQAEMAAKGASRTRVRRPGTTLKFRPRDKYTNLFAVMFGHDD